MKLFIPLSILICLLASQGCQWLTRFDTDRNIQLARYDHRDCEQRGYAWPSDAYRDCRRFLADDRQRERWQELQMARQQQAPQIGISSGKQTEPYRAIAPEHFHCSREDDAQGESYIACGQSRDGE